MLRPWMTQPITRREFTRSFAAASIMTTAYRMPRRATADEGPRANSPNVDGPRENDRRDVSWLEEIQKPPRELPAGTRRLEVTDSEGRPIRSLMKWKDRRETLRREWLEFLGPPPAERRRIPDVEVIEESQIGGVTRQLIRYEAERGEFVEAYLIRPSGRASDPHSRPGVAVFHSTVDHSIRQPAGIEGAPEKAFGLKFAQRGFVTFSPRNYLWPTNDRIAAQPEADRFLERHPKSKGMMRMLHDAMLAVDLLAAQPDVDPHRIGAVGHSLGAKETLYLAAFDDRVAATVSSEGGVGIRFSNWNADWYLGPAVDEPEFTRDHHELLALAAPRPFLLVGGESADGDRGWPFIEAALPIYRLYDDQHAPRIGQFNHRKGHAVPPDAEQRIYEWLETYL